MRFSLSPPVPVALARVPSVRSFSSAHIFHRRPANIVYDCKEQLPFNFRFCGRYCSCCCYWPVIVGARCSVELLPVSFRSFALADFFLAATCVHRSHFRGMINENAAKSEAIGPIGSEEWLERLCSCCSPFTSQHMDPRVQINVRSMLYRYDSISRILQHSKLGSTHARSSQIAWRCGFLRCAAHRTYNGPMHVCVCGSLGFLNKCHLTSTLTALQPCMAHGNPKREETKSAAVHSVLCCVSQLHLFACTSLAHYAL